MEHELTAIFNTFLDTFDNSQVQINCACWLLTDFSRFNRSFADIIINRIFTPHISPTSHYEQPILPLFYLIDVVCKTCSHGYCGIFSERLPQLFQTALHRADAHLRVKLGGLIKHWGSEHVFNEGVIDLLNKVYDSADLGAVEQPAAAEPLAPMQPYESWVFAFSAPMPEREAAHVERPAAERRLARNWMRGAVEWETQAAGSELLVVDIDSRGEPVAGVGGVEYVLVTKENERETCTKCTGVFEKVIAPNGELAFKGVIRHPRLGYMHQKCFEHDQAARPFAS
jgi:hypothetical protein